MTLPRELPTTASSRPYGSDDWGVDALADAGYAQDEFLLSGHAGGSEYTVRVLLRRPRAASTFTGVVVVEPMHFAGGRSVWPVVRREVLRSGHAWAELGCQPSSESHLKSYDRDRYGGISILDAVAALAPQETNRGTHTDAPRSFDEIRREADEFRRRWFESAVQSPTIIEQFAQAMRGGDFGLRDVTTIVFAGLSQTGGFVRNFAATQHAALSAEQPIFDGYLVMCSGGEAVQDLSVPVIEMLAESEMEELRRAHLLPGQTREYTHRRPDSATFRLYEVAGMSHSDSREVPVPGVQALPSGERWSRFPATHVVAWVLRSLVNWIRDGAAPPPSRWFALDEQRRLRRDEDGHVLGGLRTAHVDVPTASLTVVSESGSSWLRGREAPFSFDRLTNLYGDEAGYRTAVRDCLARLVSEGLYLPEDAAEYLAEADWS